MVEPYAAVCVGKRAMSETGRVARSAASTRVMNIVFGECTERHADLDSDLSHAFSRETPMNAVLAQRPHRARLPIGFLAVALLFYVVDGVLVHSSAFAERPDFFAAAASFDLTVGVTLMYWLLVVRRGLGAGRTVLPVFLLSIVAATLTLPPGHRNLLRDARYLAIPFELVMLTLFVIAVRQAQRRLATVGVSLDVPERIRAVLPNALVTSRVLEIIATEVSIFFYAFASWGREPFVPPSAQGFSYHQRNATALTFYVLFFASIVEVAAVHFVLRAVAPRLDVPVLAVSVFGAVWILGFARAVQLRPILLTDDAVLVRSGVSWRVDVPRAAIASFEFGRVNPPPKRTPGYLRATFGEPNMLITLHEPLRAYGPYGITRDVTRVGLVVDDLQEFQLAIARRWSTKIS